MGIGRLFWAILIASPIAAYGIYMFTQVNLDTSARMDVQNIEMRIREIRTECKAAKMHNQPCDEEDAKEMSDLRAEVKIAKGRVATSTEKAQSDSADQDKQLERYGKENAQDKDLERYEKPSGK